MKIALVHDHLMQFGGAERVLEIFQELFSDAPIYTLVYDKARLGNIFSPDRVHPSFLQRIPGALPKYQWFLPFMPLATEQYDLSEYDVVLSSSSAFSKGAITKSTTLHICYCHTPTRYLWSDTHSYIREVHAPRLAKAGIPLILTGLRQWDRLAADRVDRFIANSKTVQERITKYYRRSSDIIYPPVDVASSEVGTGVGEYFLAGGRLVSYKRFDVIIEAFNRLNRRLVIFGDGPEIGKLKRMAKSTIEFRGFVSVSERSRLYRDCVAFINPQEEDLGITVIEAAAAGRPVIALAAGGALETIIEGVTGVFFYDQDAPALIDTVLRFKPEQFKADVIRDHALRYSTDRFKREILQYVESSWNQWQEHQHMKRLRETKMML